MHRERKFDATGRPAAHAPGKTALNRRAFLVAGTVVVVMVAVVASSVHGAGETRMRFKRVPAQYIAALGDPNANSGNNAQLWGLWRQDPGPRGVSLDRYDRLKVAGGVAPAQWQFEITDWWLEEHGLIMEEPEFPLPPGKYLVTGDREVTTALTVYPIEGNGIQRWEFDDGATIYDVTHLRCRSARYTPATSDSSCSPAQAQISAFPVAPGSQMPPVDGCNKQDYAVLIVIGVAVENG
jgi:hypothetical protein